jgi:hypothetical protein
MGRAAIRVKSGDIMKAYRITHRRNDVALTKCPVTGIYWVVVFIPQEGWKAARIAREADLRYVTTNDK